MRRQGIALVATLAIMVVVGVLAFGTFFTTQIEQFVTRNDITSTQANYVAQAGMQKYKAALFQNYRWVESKLTLAENFTGSSGTTGSTACFNALGAGLDLDRDGVPTPFTNNRITLNPETVKDANGRAIGSYTITLIRDPGNAQIFTLESRGTSGGATSIMRMTVRLTNTGFLSNAIFAGQGQSNKFMNGNTSIRGGIYVVGTNPETPVIISNGNFQMLNDYNVRTSEYDQVVRDAMDDANEKVDDLCASLRVQYGKVDISGSSQVGTPTNKLKGVYVGRGPQDIIGTPNSSTGCPASQKYLCTEDGPSAFDILTDPPKFPTLNAPNAGCDPNNPTRSWRQCINAQAETSGKGLHLRYTASGPQLIGPSGVTLPQSCVDTLKNQDIPLGVGDTKNKGGRNVTTLNKVDCTYTNANGQKGGFLFDATGAKPKLEVYGTVHLEGWDLRVFTEVQYVARTHIGTGGDTIPNASLVLTKLDPSSAEGGNIRIEGNFLPDTTRGLFPHHVLGLVAEASVFQQGQNIMAPIYAGQTFYTGEKRKLFGSVVSNYFCTTDAGTNGNVADYGGCNAGQGSEVIYVNTGRNKPLIMQQPEAARKPVFQVLSYERR